MLGISDDQINDQRGAMFSTPRLAATTGLPLVVSVSEVIFASGSLISVVTVSLFVLTAVSKEMAAGSVTAVRGAVVCVVLGACAVGLAVVAMGLTVVAGALVVDGFFVVLGALVVTIPPPPMYGHTPPGC